MPRSLSASALFASSLLIFGLYSSPPLSLASTKLWISEPEIQRELDDLTASRETWNTIKLLHLGKRSRPARLALIKNAEHTLFMTTPLWFSDAEGQSMLEAFSEKKKASPSIDLRFTVDFMSGAATNDFLGTAMLAELKSVAGADRVIEWNRPYLHRPLGFGWKLLDNRLHEKMFIVDGQSLVMGGMNIQNTYLQGGETPEGWHDTDILLEGPVVSDALSIFMSNWAVVKYLDVIGNPMPLSADREAHLFAALYQGRLDLAAKDADILNSMVRVMNSEFDLGILSKRSFQLFPPLDNTPGIGKARVRLIHDNPLINRKRKLIDNGRGRESTSFAPYSRVMETLEFLLKHAKKRVRFFIPYLTIQSGFRDTLIATAQRGIQVEILTNSLKSHDLGDTAYMGGVTDYPAMLKAGIKIFEWQGHEDLINLIKSNQCAAGNGDWWTGNTLHTKAVIIDDSISMIGSHNMNMRSNGFNTEIMALVTDENFASELNDIFEFDMDRGHGQASKLPCPGGKVEEIARPRRSMQIDPVAIQQFVDEKKFEAGFLRNFRIYM